MENLNNQPSSQGQNRAPVAPVVAPIKKKFENYGEKADYFLDIEEQVRKRHAQLALAKSQGATNPTASPKAYADLIATIENEIKELEQQEKDMRSGGTKH